MTNQISIGLDVGSTTVKVVVLNRAGDIVYNRYQRHLSEVRQSAAQILKDVDTQMPGAEWRLCLTGSGAISLAAELNLPFVQEVVASSQAIRKLIPDVDVVIELGGEDAKLTFLSGGLDQRMNETCAGGTGAFIDQMAAFIQTDAGGLDQMALRHETIYPIASRCGVFAKTDILPLLNEGCSREDIAISIMQAVVNQTISGLARGRSIKGKVACLGGPMFFMQSLRERFQATLQEASEVIFPEQGQYYVAFGAAWQAHLDHGRVVQIKDVLETLSHPSRNRAENRLPALFANAREYDDFKERHSRNRARRIALEEGRGQAWLGFDSGSTTIKAALIDNEGRLLYSFYGPNKGEPLSAAVDILKEIYRRKHPALSIKAAAATGYGSALIKSGLQADIDEVETVAHFTAARHFQPKVDFILDIGGQDIKCLYIKDGVINKIQLNEACSAGCGSFIENLAGSLQMPLADFVEAALKAAAPVDLGTRCTVFMNSKVKQAQKDGAGLGDIAAGLSYSVIRNSCHKVMKIADPADLGEHVVAQGGSFLNDALLRTLELELGRPIVRPDIAGLMGAFGAALIARERGPAGEATGLLSLKELKSFNTKLKNTRCGQCANNCLLTVTTFADKRRFISGNRCERGNLGPTQDLPNLYAYKYERLFKPYRPLSPQKAARGLMGLPRALNIYENFPLWFTMLTELGFRVELSSPSSKDLFYKGYGTIPSQTVCYPAKLAHGHILDLIERGVKNIFYPCLPREEKNLSSPDASFNCPVVIGYPELLDKNVDGLSENGVNLIHQFLPMDRQSLAKRLIDIPIFQDIPLMELEGAVKAGFEEMDRYHEDIRRAGERALAELSASGRFGLILAGHPYHVDPEVHHGVAELINSCGLGVLTEDSVAHLCPDPGQLRVVDQWTYHSRLYRAGAFAGTTDNLAVLQLISFGCGLDAVTSDQLEEIVTRSGRLYAQIKIDEGGNLGPARIRIRSLLAALKERRRRRSAVIPIYPTYPAYTEAMKKTHTLLIPQMSPVHFQFMEAVFQSEGYKAEQLESVDREAVNLALRYVNNDACYPALVVVGQLLQAVKSGRYDPDRVALLISQTGGGCRATNYIAFLRKALADCGLGQVPLATISTNINTGQSGLKLSSRMILKALMAVQYGDALMRVLNRVAPYEAEPGAAARLAEKWVARARKNIVKSNIIRFDLNMLAMIREFDQLPLRNEPRKPRVGLVGEILLKFHPDANNQALKVVESEGGEAVVGDLMDFMLYALYDHIFNYQHLSGSRRAAINGSLIILFLEFTRWAMRLGFSLSKRFTPPTGFSHLTRKARKLVSLGHQTGEGWLLAAEMVELLESGVSNILCLQPFGCLPNHITGKGLMKELKNRHPQANIMALDYDPGASEVNQINRIKLMMSQAA